MAAKPRLTADEHTDKQPQSQATMTIGRVSLRRIQRQWPQNPDSPLTNTLTNTPTGAQTCEDAVGEVKPGEGGHEGGGHKAKTH